jgi:FKBP-type peptidyl-prolyl cis-trans isomerases 1
MKGEMRFKVLSVLCLVGLMTMAGCTKLVEPKSPEEILADAIKNTNPFQLAYDLKIIDDSLKRWNIVPAIEPNGVRYVIHEEGTGPKPTLSSVVTVDYTGKLLSSGDTFDIGTHTENLYGFIIGMRTTIPLFKEGTKATLYIPSGFAFGNSARYDSNGGVLVPAGSNLIFEIELVDVQ